MNRWAASLGKYDLEGHLSLYADHLDTFYQFSNVGKERVRSVRQAAYRKYFTSIDVQLSNMTVEINAAGTTATVTFDLTYAWRGDANSLTGKARNQIVMSKIGAQWLITSEKHLTTYYEDSKN
jgi:ketosteroid isomerase-like protein